MTDFTGNIAGFIATSARIDLDLGLGNRGVSIYGIDGYNVDNHHGIKLKQINSGICITGDVTGILNANEKGDTR